MRKRLILGVALALVVAGLVPFAATGEDDRRVTSGIIDGTVPVGQAQSPDAFERAAQAQQQTQPAFAGSPDAIDRAIASRVPPDAFERALVTHADGLTGQTGAMLESPDPALVERPAASQPVVESPGGFDWRDFGMGAGAGIGLMLVLLGLGAVVMAFRRDHSRVTTA